MADSNGYLSRDRDHLARQQRKRRARMLRVDYMPSREALAIIEAKRGRYYPLNTNTGIIDAILTEWAALTGIKCSEVEPPKGPGRGPELADQYAQARMSPDAKGSTRTQDFGTPTGINAAIAPARGRAYDSGMLARQKAQQEQRATQRVVCGAQRHRDGQPCQAKSEPGKGRCRFHGGRSTGPRTDAGKARALANLRQNNKVD